MKHQPDIVHLNVTDFQAAVAMAQDRTLADKAFVIARESAQRPVVSSVSRRAREEGLVPGMMLSVAKRMNRNLLILAPDPVGCDKVCEAMHAIASRYSPVVQNDRDGHMYIDLAGTTRLFGPRIDCAVRLRNSIASETGIDPSMAIAPNKLVAKVATRAVRPAGLACISPGDEATFLSPQDATLLPGIGPSLRRLLAVAALHEIGDIARLDDNETVALFGKQGFALRSAARGEDSTKVDPADITMRTIHRRIDFSEPLIDEHAVHAAIVQATEDAGLEMRKALLQASMVRVSLVYADGVRSQGTARSTKRLLLDSELASAASEALFHARSRRIRLQGLSISIEGLAPALREPDLFTLVQDNKREQIQYAADRIRTKFGSASVTKAAGIAHV